MTSKILEWKNYLYIEITIKTYFLLSLQRGEFMSKRKIKLLDGDIQSFWIKGEKNPCGCGSNCFHKESNEKEVYGVCNSCGLDIYNYSNYEYFDEWEFKKLNNQ